MTLLPLPLQLWLPLEGPAVEEPSVEWLAAHASALLSPSNHAVESESPANTGSICRHQYSYKNLFGTCARLYKVAQSSQDQKLQVSQAMSKFWQVAASKSFQSLPCLLHSICVTQSSSIYFSNMPREPEQLSVCWCCRHRHQRHPRLFFISVALSNIKIYVCLSIYSISALDWLESHKSSVGCHGTSQSRDSWSNELV